MKYIIKITKTEKINMLGISEYKHEVVFRESEKDALEYIRQETKNSINTKDFNIVHVVFDENDNLSIKALTGEKKWKKSGEKNGKN